LIRKGTSTFTALLWAVCPSLSVLADSGVSQTQLRDTLQGPASIACSGLDVLQTGDSRLELTDLYASGGFQPLWTETRRLGQLQTELRALANDGLAPADYGFALHASTPSALCDELRITMEYLLALEHLSRGRLPQEHQGLHWHETSTTATHPRLSALAQHGLTDISLAFEQARPDLDIYRTLRSAYAEMASALQDRQPAPRAPVASGPLLKPGMEDQRLAAIVEVLQTEGYLQEPVQSAHYAEPIEQAVRRFQQDHGLQVDGIIGPQSLRALNISPQQRLQIMRINLERLRWLDAQRGDHALLVNIASGMAMLLRGNESVWLARVQTGRPSRPTPILVSRINRITLNPSWIVPPTILREDILPAIRSDQAYLERNQLQVLDLQANPLDPTQVNWSSPVGVMLRQAPGPTNPLGQLVFRLPNPFSVYLHDTPQQQHFLRANRHLSSGCVRLEDAQGLAAVLLAGLGTAQRTQIAAQLASGLTHEVALPDGPRVILSYWTAQGTADGHVQWFPDTYTLDAALLTSLASASTARQAAPAAVMTQAEAGCALAGSLNSP